MDEDVLELVAQNDFTYEVEDESEEEYLAASGDFTERPKTANNETVRALTGSSFLINFWSETQVYNSYQYKFCRTIFTFIL